MLCWVVALVFHRYRVPHVPKPASRGALRFGRPRRYTPLASDLTGCNASPPSADAHEDLSPDRGEAEPVGGRVHLLTDIIAKI